MKLYRMHHEAMHYRTITWWIIILYILDLKLPIHQNKFPTIIFPAIQYIKQCLLCTLLYLIVVIILYYPIENFAPFDVKTCVRQTVNIDIDK